MTAMLAAVLLAAAPAADLPPADAPVAAAPAETAVAAPPPADPAPPAAQPGDIVVSATAEAPREDPAMAVNLASFEAVQAVDSVLVAPIADGYKAVVPSPARQGVHNVLNNLSEPINFVNDVLQLKPKRALHTLGRFVINSTLGVAGLFDVAAKPQIGLAYRRNGFGNTMGYYGVKPGAYLFLPLIGPTTVRDLAGRLLDLSLVPTAIGGPLRSPYYSTGTGALRSVDDRVQIDGFLDRLHHQCSDPYSAERQFYLASRATDIEALHGRTTDLAAQLPDCLRESDQPAVTTAR